MTHQIIKINNYLLVVDDSEIKDSDWYMYSNKDGSLNGPYGVRKFLHNDYSYLNAYKCKKLISHLPLNGAPVLEGVDLLPPIEDDVEQLARDNSSICEDDWVDGYNKAREKYKYTEEDMKEAFRSGAFTGAYYGKWSGDTVEKDENAFIQFIQQPKYPTAFETNENYTTTEEQFKYGRYK